MSFSFSMMSAGKDWQIFGEPQGEAPLSKRYNNNSPQIETTELAEARHLTAKPGFTLWRLGVRT